MDIPKSIAIQDGSSIEQIATGQLGLLNVRPAPSLESPAIQDGPSIEQTATIHDLLEALEDIPVASQNGWGVSITRGKTPKKAKKKT